MSVTRTSFKALADPIPGESQMSRVLSELRCPGIRLERSLPGGFPTPGDSISDSSASDPLNQRRAVTVGLSSDPGGKDHGDGVHLKSYSE